MKEKIEKIYQCYSYLVQNCDDEALRKKLSELAKEHLLFKINEASYSVEIPLQERKYQIEKLLKKLNE